VDFALRNPLGCDFTVPTVAGTCARPTFARGVPPTRPRTGARCGPLDTCGAAAWLAESAGSAWRNGWIRSVSMKVGCRARLVVFVLAAMLCTSVPASAQVDFTGVWNGNTNAEDGPERAAGPSLVEFLGLPINDEARQWGLSYRSGRLSLPEHQCQV